jgi:hypothetical protein
VNFHVIFDPDLDPAVIEEHFLREVHFTAQMMLKWTKHRTGGFLMLAIAAGSAAWALASLPGTGQPPRFDSVSLQLFVDKPNLRVDIVSVEVDEPSARPGENLQRDDPDQLREAGSTLTLRGQITSDQSTPTTVAVLLRSRDLDTSVEQQSGWEQAVFITGAGEQLAPKGAYVATTDSDDSGRFSFEAYFSSPVTVASAGLYVAINPPIVLPPAVPAWVPEEAVRRGTSSPSAICSAGCSPRPDNLEGNYYSPAIATTLVKVRFYGPHGPLAPISGSAPTIFDGAWQWENDPSGSFLAQDVGKQDQREQGLFLAGVLLGVGGGAFVAAVLEFLPRR